MVRALSVVWGGGGSAVVRAVVFVPVIHSMKALQGKNKSYLGTQRRCTSRNIPTELNLSRTLLPSWGGKKIPCACCLRVFEASQPVGGRFLGGNGGITVCCHTPKYSAYRDINRSRGKTDQQSCGLSVGCIRQADALARTRTNTDHAA